MTDTGRRLERVIERDPGIHFNGIVRRLDLANGQVQFHIRRLLAEGTIIDERIYGRTHYYPADCGEFERGALAILRRETARDILLVLLDTGGDRPATVAETLEVARGTLEWHLDHLQEQGLVAKRRDDRNRVTLVAVRPATTIALLAEIEPSLPDRMVDRFTRLVDRFLAE